MRLGSRVASHIATPMGTDTSKQHPTQHSAEKHGHSRRSGATRSRNSLGRALGAFPALDSSFGSRAWVGAARSESKVSACMPPFLDTHAQALN